ncbi:MAG TPA: cupin domain-containing protein, partial [Candidatus Binataceae bacterium]|nr:cupin domain-containing protein [Candidatus Binataceae bacterium]
MDAKGLVVPPGGGSILSMAPGRSAALKLLAGDTGDRIMAFEETAPAGAETTFHLHRDSDEVAYVLSGEITFKIGDEVTVGGPGTWASYHAVYRTPGKIPVPKPTACCFSIPRPVPAAFSRNSWRGRPGRPTD